jgi:hypothetical protein
MPELEEIFLEGGGSYLKDLPKKDYDWLGSSTLRRLRRVSKAIRKEGPTVGLHPFSC